MKNVLRDLLDKVYEMEGLLHLALKRDDETDNFTRLIMNKGKDISDLCKNLIHSSHSNTDKEKIEEIVPIIPSEIRNEDFMLDEYTISEEDELEEEKQFSIPVSEYSDEETKDLEDISENRSEHQKGKLVFSVNDRFRFRKELFDNSDIDFNNTLALMASMENYEEAEDYFINEEGFDASNPVVMEFMEIVKKYFK